jgi:hypothetical protein
MLRVARSLRSAANRPRITRGQLLGLARCWEHRFARVGFPFQRMQRRSLGVLDTQPTQAADSSGLETLAAALATSASLTAAVGRQKNGRLFG